jgi:hypothetical protein
MAHSWLRIALAHAGLFSALAGPAAAAEIHSGDGVEIRWDNTLRYSLGLRPLSRSAELLSYINGDDGDRNFAPGLVTNRLDLFSALDIAAGEFGAHASAATWYDTAYQRHSANHLPTTDNSTAAAGSFPPAVRDLLGQHAELVDAFVYGNFALGEMPVSVRAGRQTLLGGESRFFDANSIAAAMAPTDYLKFMTDHGGYSGNMFLPVTQASLTFQPRPWLSLSLYDQFEWRASRQAPDGSFLSYVDYVGAGAGRVLLSPAQYLALSPDRGPASGQYGLFLHASVSDFDVGFYALRFRAKDPLAALVPDPALAGQYGAAGYYRLVYPAGINLYGASFSTEWNGKILAGEISAREEMPVVSYDARTPQLAAPTHMPYYARSDTLHAQLSLVTELAETGLWDRAETTTEIATDHILGTPSYTPGAPPFSNFSMKIRTRFEPHYFQVLPNLDVNGVGELGINVTGRGFSYYAQNEGAGDFRIGVSGTYLSAWKGSIAYVGFIGSPSRQPLADRDFVILSLERTF